MFPSEDDQGESHNTPTPLQTPRLTTDTPRPLAPIPTGLTANTRQRLPRPVLCNSMPRTPGHRLPAIVTRQLRLDSDARLTVASSVQLDVRALNAVPKRYRFEMVRLASMFAGADMPFTILSIYSLHSLFLVRRVYNANTFAICCVRCAHFFMQPAIQQPAELTDGHLLVTRKTVELFAGMHDENCPHRAPINWALEHPLMVMESTRPISLDQHLAGLFLTSQSHASDSFKKFIITLFKIYLILLLSTKFYLIYDADVSPAISNMESLHEWILPEGLDWLRAELPLHSGTFDSRISNINSRQRLAQSIPCIASLHWPDEIIKEYDFDPILLVSMRYPPILNPSRCLLWYFFTQAPIDPNIPPAQRQPTPILLSEARRRTREVSFDRGQMREPADSEALAMADCRKRIESFTRSSIYTRGYREAFLLSMMGFFHIEITDHPDAIRCSFCKQTFDLGLFALFSI